MSDLHKIKIRAFTVADEDILDHYRAQYPHVTLDVPHGYMMQGGVETGVAVREDGSIIGSVTASHVIVLDPFIRDPNASEPEIGAALSKLETAFSYIAQAKMGAVDVYISIPDVLKGYQAVVQRRGYQPTARTCTVFRLPLAPEVKVK